MQASVTDATSGPTSPTASRTVTTSTPGTFVAAITGADRAGNVSAAACQYRVVIPQCNGYTPTLLGNDANNVINGTSGRDVIAGAGGADTIYRLGGDDVICGGDARRTRRPASAVSRG